MPEAKPTSMAIALYLAGLMATMASGQPGAKASRPTFEAASINPNKSCPGPQIRILPGRLAVNCASLLDLMTFAYAVRTDQVAEGPSWIASDHYDIEATAAGNTSGAQIAGPMFQALLEDRFKPTLHREMRELPVYALVFARSGLKLQPSQNGSCTPFSPNSAPARPAAGVARLPVCGYPRTGRKELTWTMDGEGITIGTSDDMSQPSLVTALLEQLGLRMEATKGPVEVLAIYHVERPSEN